MEDKIFQVVLLASLAHCDPKLQWEGLLARVQGQATHFRIFKPQKNWTHSSLSSLDPRTTTQPIAAVTAHHCWLRSILYLPSNQFQLLPPLPSSRIPPAPKIHPLCRLAASPSSDESHEPKQTATSGHLHPLPQTTTTTSTMASVSVQNPPAAAASKAPKKKKANKSDSIESSGLASATPEKAASAAGDNQDDVSDAPHIRELKK